MQLARALTEGAPQQGSTTPAQTSIGAAAAQVAAVNRKRKGLIIQNTGTTVLKFTFGTGTPTQTVYHFALKACSAADDGTGGIILEENWIGPVQGISSGAGGTFVLTEITAAGVWGTWDVNADWGTAG